MLGSLRIRQRLLACRTVFTNMSRTFGSMVEDKPAEQSFARRDQLLAIEDTVRQQWSSAKVYERNAPADPVEYEKKNKFMATFPYPYMNGALHLGHAFSVVKAEYAVRFQHLLGKNSLFPFGFHCTGMPIAACAEKLTKEIAAFGNPPVFPAPVEVAEEQEDIAEEELAEPEPESGKVVIEEKKRRKKGKLAGKTSKEVYQWNIMKEMGVPESEIAKFQDPLHWLHYFPPIAIRDLNQLGLAIDWRRTFITTDVNPYYDAFVRWQFNTLRNKPNKLAFGKLMCICTPSNKQVCADHDRREGEGVTAQGYTLIKLRMVAPYPESLVTLLANAGLSPSDDNGNGIDVILPAATLRPETMYGQTNAFVLPTGTYQVYKVSNNEVYVCTRRSALNMAHQYDVFEGEDFVYGQPESRFLGDISGQDLLGRAIKAPYATYEKVYTLPLLTISMDKGTGIVTSVPSDAPADYAALMDMKKKPEFRAKYGIEDYMVEPYEVVPILNIEGYENEAVAPFLCKKYGVKSQNDIVVINKIKDEAYNLGFAKGIMNCGDYKGQFVKDVKDIIKQDMINKKLAVPYAEPESRVVSRTDEECVAASIDQWFLNYGEEEWKESVKNHVDSENFTVASKPILHRIKFTLDWLQKWGCSRSFGLGTRLPFDERYLIESLSDSTIYMAYYTIASLLQGGPENIDGSHVGPAKISPEQLNDALFNYVFLDEPYTDAIKVPEDVVAKMKREFEYWYPLDLRVSGKDLLNNHLVMALYNHDAVWDGRSDRMPKSFYANGLLMIDNQKMSKSTGNFLTLSQALAKYGADATRFGLASSGDSLDDANFSSQIANNAILRLTRELAFIEETIQDINGGKLRDGELLFWDKNSISTFGLNVREARFAYDQMRMLDVVRFACHDFCNVRDQYRLACSESSIPMHREVLLQWMHDFAIILSPICPFWCQRIWELLAQSGLYKDSTKFVYDATWPFESEEKIDAQVLAQSKYLNLCLNNLRTSHAKNIVLITKKLKAKSPVTLTKLTIRIAKSYPAWQVQIIEKLHEIIKDYKPTEEAPLSGILSSPIVVSAIKTMYAGHPNKKMNTMAMAFIASLRSDYAENGVAALNLSMPFDEEALIRDHLAYLIRGLEPITSEIVQIEHFTPPEDANVTGGATPGKPQFIFGTD